MTLIRVSAAIDAVGFSSSSTMRCGWIGASRSRFPEASRYRQAAVMATSIAVVSVGVRSRLPRNTVSINATMSSSQWVRTVSHHCCWPTPAGRGGIARALSRSGIPGPSRSTVPSTACTTGTHSPRMSQGTTNGRPKSACRVAMVLASDGFPGSDDPGDEQPGVPDQAEAAQYPRVGAEVPAGEQVPADQRPGDRQRRAR